MTHKEILEKALDIAFANGYAPTWAEQGNIFRYRKDLAGTPLGDLNEVKNYLDVADVIYDKEFAQALWGDDDDEYRCVVCGTKFKHEDDCPFAKTLKSHWISPVQYHLQQMVIADDPIQYLGENI